MRLSVIIPTLNAATTLHATWVALVDMTLLPQFRSFEIIVADGGSTDDTLAVAARIGARVVMAPRGRGTQMAAGAASSTGAWLLFLHADTCPGQNWHDYAVAFMTDPANAMRAGYFRFALDDAAPQARRLERRVAWRAHALGLPYGDQGLLLSRALYDGVGGYAAIPLMEDVDLVRRIGRKRLAAIPVDFITDGRKFHGQWRRRSARNLCILAMYFLGVPPGFLRKLY